MDGLEQNPEQQVAERVTPFGLEDLSAGGALVVTSPTDLVDPDEVPDTDTPHPDETLWIPLGEISELGTEPNYRTPSPQAIDELASTMRTQGQLEPVLVRPAPDGADHGKPWELVYGYRRKAAAEMLEWENLRCDVRHLSDVEVLLMRITENAQRENPSPMEEIQTIKQLLDEHGFSQSKVAKMLGKDPSQISHRLSLLRLPESVQERVHRGELKVSHAEAIAALPNPVAQEKVAGLAVGRGWSIKKVTDWIQTVKEDSEREHEMDGREIPQIAPHEVIDLPSLQVRDGLDGETVNRIILYGQLRNWMDTEMLEYLEAELNVPFEKLWDYVRSLDDQQVWQLVERMAIRYVSSAHRFPSLERSLRDDLGAAADETSEFEV
jgi:ParB/RepB/Spo0J family partition protein